MNTLRPRRSQLQTRLFLVAGGLFVAFGAMLGCQIAVVDLGSNHATVGSDAGADAGMDSAIVEPVITEDCPEVTEAQIAPSTAILAAPRAQAQRAPRAWWGAGPSSSG